MSSQDFSSSNPKIWASSKTLRDICEAYLDICEKKDYTSPRDQDQDGDNDFADNMIARMVASGMSREEAIRKVKNKEYNKKSQVKEETSKEKDERLAARRARVRELESQGRTETPSSRTSRSKTQKQAQERQTAAEKILADLGVSSRRSSQPMGSQEPETKPKAPEANRKLKSNTKNDTLAQKADEVLSQLRKEEVDNYNIVVSYLLENNFAETIDDANIIIENMSYEWLGTILEESDHEQSMIRVELKSAMDAINRLMKKMKGEGNVEAWVQSKITRAADYLDSAAKYIDSE